MKISELFGKGKTVFSFEVFPTSKTGSIDTIYNAVKELKDLKPDYISVTYGAGGNAANKDTVKIASFIKNDLGIEAMAHLTCINSNKDTIETVLSDFKENNIENILALRGDINPNVPPQTDFRYANELISYLKEKGNFGISTACYPEGHPECESIVQDIKNLKQKADSGAQSLVTQLFFDNDVFYRFRDMAQLVGIITPISAGIMPVTNKKQIERMVSMSGASLPPKFTKMISKYENKPDSLIDAGIAYAVDQIVDLISNGAEGVHVYIMNRPYVARKITEAVRNLL